jgi:hypothetical protein
MSRRGIWIGAALLVVLSFGLGLLLDVRATASSSSLSLSARGLFLARRYLEERGLVIDLLDRDLAESAPDEVLVLAFPWQRWVASSEQMGLGRVLRGEGTVVFAYSGERGSSQEEDVARWLGLEWEELRSEAPLSPRSWYAFANEEWALDADADRISVSSGVAPLSVLSFARAPRPPAGSSNVEVLYREPGGKPVVFAYTYLGGRVLVLPAEALSNARLSTEGNLDFLESLAQSLGESWSFDEYHHGLSAPLSDEKKHPRVALDLFLIHLGVLYLLVVWSLARPFGPVWPGKPVVTGSTRTFLLGLGALHDELGHHRDAATLLWSRASELQPRVSFSGSPTADTGPELVEVGRAVSREQNG